MERDDLLYASILEVVGEEPVAFKPLQRRLCYWERTKSPRSSGQPPDLPPTDQGRLLSQMTPSDQG